MGEAAQQPIVSAASDLAWGAAQPERHGALEREVFAVAGAEVAPARA